MKKIPLTQGKYALVDDSDFEYLNQWKWYYGSRYAVRRGPKDSKIYMHKIVLSKKGYYTDHINGDRLDNRKINLRACTNQLNQANRGKPSNNTTGFKGVYPTGWGKWRARLFIYHKGISGGTYNTKEEAALAYNNLATKYFGEFAKLNEV